MLICSVKIGGNNKKHHYSKIIKQIVMKQVLEKKGLIAKDKSSSWKVKYDKKVKMSVEEQSAYRESNWDEILKKVVASDAKWAAENITLSEVEIADIVSKNRREEYEASLRD